jgi:hypothetical protein
MGFVAMADAVSRPVRVTRKASKSEAGEMKKTPSIM